MYKMFVEKQFSKETMKHWTLEPSRERPYFFPFVQYVTKTRLHRTLPAQMIEPNPNLDLVGLKQRLAETGGFLSLADVIRQGLCDGSGV